MELNENKLHILAKSHHRNGIGGNPFVVSVVQDDEDGDRKLVIMFDEKYSTAVLSLDKLIWDGTITFGENSYRGDMFDDALRDKLTEVR
jgi:hypothetical protein